MIFCNYYLVDKKGSIIDQFVRHDFKKGKIIRSANKMVHAV